MSCSPFVPSVHRSVDAVCDAATVYRKLSVPSLRTVIVRSRESPGTRSARLTIAVGRDCERRRRGGRRRRRWSRRGRRRRGRGGRRGWSARRRGRARRCGRGARSGDGRQAGRRRGRTSDRRARWRWRDGRAGLVGGLRRRGRRGRRACAVDGFGRGRIEELRRDVVDRRRDAAEEWDPCDVDRIAILLPDERADRAQAVDARVRVVGRDDQRDREDAGERHGEEQRDAQIHVVNDGSGSRTREWSRGWIRSPAGTTPPRPPRGR